LRALDGLREALRSPQMLGEVSTRLLDGLLITEINKINHDPVWEHLLEPLHLLGGNTPFDIARRLRTTPAASPS
jgi:hypothetical protein